MKWLMLVTFCLASHTQVYAQDNIFQKIQKFFFPKTETPLKTQIVLPPIPKLDQSNTSTTIFDKVEKEISIEEEKLNDFFYYYIHELYEVVDEKKIESDHYALLYNAMKGGATPEGLYRSVVLNTEYLSTERAKKLPSTKSVEFSVNFLKKYCGFNVSQDSINQFDFYSLKIQVVEKGLEILDAFSNEKDLAAWYAILSNELAQEYPEAFKQDDRKIADVDFYNKSAIELPLRFIKAEYIIKMHLVLNYLNI